MAFYDARAEMEKLNARIMELTAENESYKACVFQYEQDFQHEREDRIRAVKERTLMEENVKAYMKPIEVQPKSPPKQGLSLTGLPRAAADRVLSSFSVMSNVPFIHDANKAALTEENERLKLENDNMKRKISNYEYILSSKQKELDLVKANLEAVKANLESMEIIMQKQSKVLNEQLAAAKEEIAVKVAQVKQYQKQVEVCKGQMSQSAEIKQQDCKSSSSFEPSHPEHSDPSLRGQAKRACDGDNRLKPSSVASQNAASSCVPGKEGDVVDDDLPPPIFHKPNQLMYHPAVAHGMQKENVPISQLETSKPSAMCNRDVGHTHGNPPSMAKLPQPVDLAAGIDDDISRVAAEVQRQTGYTVL